jgi:error-prone DNA polymerase
VRGKIQSEKGVIHIVARELFDMSGHLAALAEKAPSPADFLARGDEVRRSVEDDGRASKPGKRVNAASLAAKILPQGRNFH